MNVKQQAELQMLIALWTRRSRTASSWQRLVWRVCRRTLFAGRR
jgi:hypothetical protein